MSDTGPFNGELDPADSFGSHAKNRVQPRKQHEGLKRTAEGLRKIGAIITDPRCNAQLAHAELDNLIRLSRTGHTRLADIHIRDIGENHKLARVFEDAGVNTVGDLAHCCATKMPLSLTILDALKVTLAALRRGVDLER